MDTPADPSPPVADPQLPTGTGEQTAANSATGGIRVECTVPVDSEGARKLRSGEVTLAMLTETAQLVVDAVDIERDFDNQNHSVEQERVPFDAKDDWQFYLPRATIAACKEAGDKQLRHCKRYSEALQRMPAGHKQRPELQKYIEKRKAHVHKLLGARREALDKETRDRKKAAEEAREARTRAREIMNSDLRVRVDSDTGQISYTIPTDPDPKVDAVLKEMAAKMHQRIANVQKVLREPEGSQEP
jgi:hypothetical protein